MTTLRLILGDQLNPTHSWFETVDASVHYTLMEVRSETDYVLHHAQKVIAIFAGMRDLAAHLKQQGHTVHYFTLDDPANQQSFADNLARLSKDIGATRLQYQLPDEWRMDQTLQKLSETLDIPVEGVDSEHFMTNRDTVANLFKARKQWLMEHFYRTTRQQTGILMDEGQPVGGQWNFDAENRKPWRGKPDAPKDERVTHDHSALWTMIQANGVKTFGNPQAQAFRWPLNRAQALSHLKHFIDHILPSFGDFEDAMSVKSWRLFHSLISFSLNSKMLSPREVIDAAELAWRENRAPLAAVEGFVRQIMGWREYVRGIYWSQMPGYDEGNALEHHRPLPKWFWSGETRMNCLSHSIGQSLEHAYAHHIQRLMVIGNFALLAGLDPKAVHHWYLGVYIDAFEWVELPNTVGMSQFADGGLLATKPYVSSGAYIDRMSDYCKGCHYNRKERTTESACPFNALYWDFYLRHEAKFSKNPRIGMAYRQLAKMAPDDIANIKQRASDVISNIDNL
ncbi:MAG: cryptochrome/photolyase family protein [Orrella sp.]